MRRELVWALGASTLLSAWALLNPASRSDGGAVVAPVERPVAVAVPDSGDPGRAAPVKTTAERIAQAPPLPAAWPAPRMEAANRSPFLAPAPPAPKPVASAPAAPPAPPPPPAITYRFWGSLSTPAGEHVLYVARDDNAGAQPIAVQVGTRLDGGYQVEQITAGAIVLVQTESQRHVTLSLTPPAIVGAH